MRVCVFCSVTIPKETSFFFVAYFLLSFVIFWLKFSLPFLFRPFVVLHFLVTVVSFIIIGNEETKRRRERDKERDLRGSSFTRGAKRGY